MPKTAFERTIDSGSVLRGGSGGGSGSGGGVGITDHRQLSGLGGDDHAQYHNDTRGDIRYYTKALEDAWRAAHIALPDVHHARATAVAPLSVSGQQVSLSISDALEVVSNALRIKRHTDSGLAIALSGGLTLGTPLTLGVATANSVSGVQHGHAVDSSADPNATASLLATTSAGLLTLRNLAARQAVQSYATFASGFAGSGWRVDYGVTTANRASAEFDDLTVRRIARFYELLIQQIRATNGSLFVASGSKVVAVAQESSDWLVNGDQLYFNGAAAVFDASFYTINTAAAGDSDRSLYHGFLYGDLPVAQQVQWDGTQFTGVILSRLEVTRVDSLTQYGAALYDGDAPAAGYDYVRRGNSVDPARRGAIYLTSDDSAAPFIDIIDGLISHADWGSANLKRTRLGKLTGISDVDFGGPLSGYGIYTDNGYFKGKVVVTGGNAATTDYVDNGLSVKASTAYVDAIAALKANLTYVDSSLAAAVAPLAQITYVDDRVTHIDGGSITTGTINANRISAVNLAVLQAAVANLSALSANLGTVTAGSLVIGSTNRLWLNDAGDGTLRIGGSTKSAAPFQVSAGGHLDAVDATFGDLQISGGNSYIDAPVSWALTTKGYKFKFGTNVAAGMTATYNAGSYATLSISNNASAQDGGSPLNNIDSSIYVTSTAGGSGKIATVVLMTQHSAGGNAGEIRLAKIGTARSIQMRADSLQYNDQNIWHAGNLTPSSYAPLAGATFTGNVSAPLVAIGAVTIDGIIKFTATATEPAYSSIPNGQIWLYMMDGGSGTRKLKARGKGTGGGTAEATLITTGT